VSTYPNRLETIHHCFVSRGLNRVLSVGVHDSSKRMVVGSISR
jgi:hypothetical protein